MGKNGGTDLLVEHDHSARVGKVLSSWEGPRGELRVQGVVSDRDAASSVMDGSMRGLSLGTGVTFNARGKPCLRSQDEVSLCVEPRRGGCYIDEIDGQSVRSTSTFSAGAKLQIQTIPLDHKAQTEPNLVDLAEGNRIRVRMSDAPQEPATTTPPVAGETYSKEFVDDLKAQLARQQEKSAGLEARQAAEDARRRETLKELQPTVMEFMKDALTDETMAPYKHEMGPMTAFAEGLHEANSIETALPLARTIACFSAKYKRKVEEFAQTSDASELLAKANKELDEVKAERDAKAQRVTELEGLADERLKAAEDLQQELAKIGGIKEKYDFSKLGSREVSNASAGGVDKKEPPSRLRRRLAGGPAAGFAARAVAATCDTVVGHVAAFSETLRAPRTCGHCCCHPQPGWMRRGAREGIERVLNNAKNAQHSNSSGRTS